MYAENKKKVHGGPNKRVANVSDGDRVGIGVKPGGMLPATRGGCNCGK